MFAIVADSIACFMYLCSLMSAPNTTHKTPKLYLLLMCLYTIQLGVLNLIASTVTRYVTNLLSLSPHPSRLTAKECLQQSPAHATIVE